VPGWLLLLQVPTQSPSVSHVQHAALRLLLLSNGSVQNGTGPVPFTQKLKIDGGQMPEHDPKLLSVGSVMQVVPAGHESRVHGFPQRHDPKQPPFVLHGHPSTSRLPLLPN